MQLRLDIEKYQNSPQNVSDVNLSSSSSESGIENLLSIAAYGLEERNRATSAIKQRCRSQGNRQWRQRADFVPFAAISLGQQQFFRPMTLLTDPEVHLYVVRLCLAKDLKNVSI